MKVSIYVPDHVDSFSYTHQTGSHRVSTYASGRRNSNAAETPGGAGGTLAGQQSLAVVIPVAAEYANAMWSFLEPMLLKSRQPALAALLMIDHALASSRCFPADRVEQVKTTLRQARKRQLSFRRVATRQFLQDCSSRGKLTAVSKCFLSAQTKSLNVAIILIPYSQTKLQYIFAGYLIAWEHRIIRAQSLNGYVSTLGGGFFLCHHFQTAICLAQQQQRLAIVLNRPDTYILCWIHQAYSHIYAGYFRSAWFILMAVEHATRDAYPTLFAMCQSAKLQCRRMKRAALSSADSTTVDDYMRIRVVSDRSKQDDLRGSLVVV